MTDVYGRRAITRERALPTLQAAHVVPVSKGGHHRVDNGLLLRSDVHTLFDGSYLMVTPDHTFRVSSKLEDDFDDGETYRELTANGSGFRQVLTSDRIGSSRDTLSEMIERLDRMRQTLREFVAERQYPKNLAMAVVSDVGELAAEYRWLRSDEVDEWSAQPENRERVAAEAADVGIVRGWGLISWGRLSGRLRSTGGIIRLK